MEGATNRQRDHPLSASRSGQFHRCCQCCLFARDNNLTRRVEVGDGDMPLARMRSGSTIGGELRGCLAAHFLQWLLVHTDNGSHAARTDGSLVMHQATTFAHQLNGVS